MKNKMSIAILILFSFTMLFASMGFGDVVVIFDEDEKDEAGNGDFAGLFTSHDAASTVIITDDDFITGKSSAFCTPSQSYNPNMAGFSYSVDDYPYISFSWRKDGGDFIMLQLAHDGAWAYRYWTGPTNLPGWEGIQVQEDGPEEWTSYTFNLVDDFGGGWNLTGLAFTPWDGEGGYYDHILLHSEEDEGIIDFAVEAQGKLITTWAELKQ